VEDHPRIERPLRGRSPLRTWEQIVAHRKDDHRASQIRQIGTIRKLISDRVSTAAGGQGFESVAVSGTILEGKFYRAQAHRNRLQSPNIMRGRFLLYDI
jgi:hypothetical protein